MSEKIQKIIQQKVLDLLKEGIIPWRKTRDVAHGAAKNIVTNKVYQGSNYLLLNCQGYISPYWMTYKQASTHGGHVKKGEKSTPISVWRPFKPKPGQEEDDNKFKRGYYGMAWIFNLGQTEDVKLPVRDEIAERKYNNSPIENCEQILSEFKDPPGTMWGVSPCYNLTMDEIGMPRIEKFETSEEYYATFFHEMGHSTRHLTRLNREKVSKAKEELVAEMTACFLCAEAGIETAVIDNQVAYIDDWRKSISEDVKLVMAASSEAQKAANYIMGINQFTKLKDEQNAA